MTVGSVSKQQKSPNDWRHIPSIFLLNIFVILWLPSLFYSWAGDSDWISHEVLSLHFSLTPASAFLYSLRFCSLGFQLWHCQSVGVIPQKAGKVKCRDEEWLLSHISWCIIWNSDPLMSGGGSDTHNTMISNSAGKAVFESHWCICWLMHCYPQPFSLASSAKRHSTWADWSKIMSTPFTQWLPEACMLTPPSHKDNTCSNLHCNPSTCSYIKLHRKTFFPSTWMWALQILLGGITLSEDNS